VVNLMSLPCSAMKSENMAYLREREVPAVGKSIAALAEENSPSHSIKVPADVHRHHQDQCALLLDEMRRDAAAHHVALVRARGAHGARVRLHLGAQRLVRRVPALRAGGATEESGRPLQPRAAREPREAKGRGAERAGLYEGRAVLYVDREVARGEGDDARVAREALNRPNIFVREHDVARLQLRGRASRRLRRGIKGRAPYNRPREHGGAPGAAAPAAAPEAEAAGYTLNPPPLGRDCIEQSLVLRPLREGWGGKG